MMDLAFGPSFILWWCDYSFIILSSFLSWIIQTKFILRIQLRLESNCDWITFEQRTYGQAAHSSDQSDRKVSRFKTVTVTHSKSAGFCEFWQRHGTTFHYKHLNVGFFKRNRGERRKTQLSKRIKELYSNKIVSAFSRVLFLLLCLTDWQILRQNWWWWLYAQICDAEILQVK